jgi:hypothetical protein
MGPEAKLYQKLKRDWNEFSFNRLENSSLLGTPDVLVYNNNRHFFTIELKVTSRGPWSEVLEYLFNVQGITDPGA